MARNKNYEEDADKNTARQKARAEERKADPTQRLLMRARVGLGVRFTPAETIEVARTIMTQNVQIQVLNGLVEEYGRLMNEEDEEETTAPEVEEAAS